MITSTHSYFDFEPPAPSLLETATALKKNPGDNDLFAAASWMAGRYGACTLTTQSLAQMAGITPAVAANSRYRLIQSGFLCGKFVRGGLMESAWSLTLPHSFTFDIISNADILRPRFTTIEQRLTSGDWVTDEKSAVADVSLSQSAIEIWDAILREFKSPWAAKWYRVLAEGVVPLGVRWNILFTRIVTDECYQWLESLLHRSMDVPLQRASNKTVRFIDYSLDEIPVGMLPAHSIIRSASNQRRGPAVNGRPICGFCGCESPYWHSHLPFRVLGLDSQKPAMVN